jgi:KipI family sensor histidine kinase inhibitor
VPPDADISWLSDCVLRVVPGGGASQDEVIARAWNIADAIRADAIRASAIDGVEDVTLAYAGVQVRVRERVAMDAHAAAAVEARVRSAVEQAAGASESSGAARRVVEMPVCYDAEFGLDLEWLAREIGRSVDEVIALHAGATYHVHFLGFLPGFGYMGGVPEVLRVPRHSSPRTRVPAGSVAIAGAQAGIYPSDTPGGWRIVGRTPRAVFDPSRDVPSLLQPGDEVRFVPIDRARFDELAATERPRDGART